MSSRRQRPDTGGVTVGRLVPKIVRTGREKVSVIAPVGSQSHAGGGLDERLHPRPGREPAQPSRLRQLLPGTRHGADRDASRLPLPCRDHADVDRRTRTGETQRPCVTVHTQRNRPHRRVERRDDRPARADLEPAATESCARCAHDKAGPCSAADQPAHPSRTTNRELHGQLLTNHERLRGPQSSQPNGNRDRASVRPTDDHARNTSA